MKKAICMMVVWLLCASATATMAQQDTTRRNKPAKGQTSRTDSTQKPPGTVKRDTTHRG